MVKLCIHSLKPNPLAQVLLVLHTCNRSRVHHDVIGVSARAASYAHFDNKKGIK